jgi:phosphate transport system substrate-binding protein
MKKTMVITLVITAALAMCSTSTPAAENTGILQIDGSTTVGPLADAFAEVFKKKYQDATFTVKKTGSGDGAAALIDGRCDIATMSRFMKAEEIKKAVDKGVFPTAHAIAMDGVCVIVHPSNPVTNLTKQQIHDIYTGKITNWKELGGADLQIVAITRDSSSGTFEVFNEKVMKKDKMAGSVETVNANPQAQARVKSTQGAIAYVGLAFQEGTKTLKVDNIVCTKGTVKEGIYPIARPLYLFTNGFPEPGTIKYDFCTFYLSEKGQEIIEAKGFVPFTSY